MEKVAFRIGNFEIMWYALIIMLGVILGLIVVDINTKRRKDLNISFDEITDAFMWAFPLALIGARLYYVFFEWDSYKNNLREILNFRGGGLAIHGGILGALVGVLIYKALSKKKASSILDMADAAAPAMILAQAVGRWGNFINQEAYGSEVSREYMMKFPKFIYDGMFINGRFYHPTFLYESLWNLLVFIILMVLFKRRKKEQFGIILGSYLMLYSLGRFFIEGLRTDSLYAGPFRVAQVISVILFILGLFLILRALNRKPLDNLTEQANEVLDTKETDEVIKEEKSSLRAAIERSTKTDVEKQTDLDNKVETLKEEKAKIENDLSSKLLRASEKMQSNEDTVKKDIDAKVIPEDKPTQRRSPGKGIVKSQGELVEPITEKKVSLKDKLKASREKSKERVKSLDKDIVEKAEKDTENK